MGFVKDVVTAPFKAAKGVVDTISGKPAGSPVQAYEFDDKAFINPENKNLLKDATAFQKDANKQINLAEKNQLAIRKEQLQTAKALGLISEQQAAIEEAALAEQEQLINQQSQNIAALEQQASGQGPSLSENLLQDATDRGIKQIQGNIASQRGVPAGVALRTGAQAISDLQQQAVSDAANLRLQEQMEARKLLSDALASTRGQSMQTGQAAAGTRLQATGSAGDLQGNIRGQDLASKEGSRADRQFQQGLRADVSESDRLAQMKKEALKSGQSLDVQQANLARDQAARQGQMDFISNIGGAAIGAFPMGGKSSGGTVSALPSSIGSTVGGSIMGSDINLKKDIKKADTIIDEFLDKLKPYQYEYKEEIKDELFGGEGKFVSPMAQDIEKSKMGGILVVDTPEGKMIDYDKAKGVTLASLGVLNERLKKLEKALGLDEDA